MNRIHVLILPAALFGSALVALFAFLTAAQGSAPVQTAPRSTAAPTQAQPAPAVSECALPAGYPDKVTRWCADIEAAAARHGLDPDLIAALMLEESGGDPQIISRNGAVGLLQVMPRDGAAADFQCQRGPCFASRPSTDELRDPAYNLDYGARLLAGLIAKTGGLRDGLLAYGPLGVGYTYADTVLAIQSRYRS
jgi:soluble lytic murein transglycosylase-like protein